MTIGKGVSVKSSSAKRLEAASVQVYPTDSTKFLSVRRNSASSSTMRIFLSETSDFVVSFTGSPNSHPDSIPCDDLSISFFPEWIMH